MCAPIECDKLSGGRSFLLAQRPLSESFSASYLVSAVGDHGHSLLRNCDVLDMGEVLRARLLDAGQQQETVAVLRKNRMRLNVQPLVLRGTFLVRLPNSLHINTLVNKIGRRAMEMRCTPLLITIVVRIITAFGFCGHNTINATYLGTGPVWRVAHRNDAHVLRPR